MAEQANVQTDQTNDAGKEPQQQDVSPQPNANDGGEQSDDMVRMTQEQLNAVIARRVERASSTAEAAVLEKLGFKSTDELAKTVADYQALQEAQMSELEKAQKRAEDAQRARDEAFARANSRLLRAAFIEAGAELHVQHPLDAMALADAEAVTIDEQGNVTGVKEQVERLIAEKRLPTTGRPVAPNLDSGAGGGNREGERVPQLTQEELEMATKLGLKPEEYAAGKRPA